jgi:hypothetical protein
MKVLQRLLSGTTGIVEIQVTQSPQPVCLADTTGNGHLCLFTVYDSTSKRAIDDGLLGFPSRFTLLVVRLSVH